jgi:hypothetical protein
MNLPEMKQISSKIDGPTEQEDAEAYSEQFGTDT